MQYSIVNLSQVKANDWRLDGEYWLPEYLENEKLLKKNGIKISECLQKENIKNIKNVTGDFDFEYLEISNTNACDYETNSINSKEIPDRATYMLKEKDICVSTVRPNLNAVAFIKNHGQKYIVGTSGFCILRCNHKIALPEFVYIFSKTKFFINSLIRENKATMYPAVSDFDIKKTYIPLLSTPFQTQIAKLVQRAFELQQSSQTLYKQAETLLLEELGLLNWKPKHQLWYVKNYSDTVQANRMDAEYFQPKYEEVLEKIKNVNSNILDNIVDYQKGIEVGSEAYTEEGIDFIRISDFSTKGIKESSQKIDEKLFLELKDKYSPKQGDILFTKDGTIGLTYVVNESLNVIISGAFLKLRPKIKIEPEYLTLVLNSIVCKKQIEQFSGGAIIAHLKPSDAMNLQIPLLPLQTQQQISQKVVESKENDKTSKSLLETAKKAVEIAIENSKEVAMEFIKENVE